MKLSLCQGAKGPPIQAETTWDEFVDSFRTTNYDYTHKIDVPAFSPAVFPTRERRNPIELSLAVLEYDDITDDQLTALVRSLSTAALIYYTWSHGKARLKGLNRVRLVMPLSVPVPASSWKTDLWQRLAQAFPGADRQDCDPGRLYFGPYAPKDGPRDQPPPLVLKGPPLDIYSLPTAPQAGAFRPTKDVAKGLLPKWRKVSDPRAVLAPALQALIRGEPLADPGQRHETTRDLVWYLCLAWPTADAQALTNLFAESIQVMPPATLDNVLALVTSAQAKVAKDQSERQSNDRAIRIRQAFYPIDRPDPYTSDELREFAETLRCPPDELTKRWIIQYQEQYYFLVKGQYTPPYPRQSAQSAALRDLSPAPITLYDVDGNPIPIQSLAASHGTVARKVDLDLTIQQATYNPESYTLTEAAAPLRALTPEYNETVNTWLELLAGPKDAQSLKDWVQFVTRIQDPCKMLLITGVPRAGKGLLAYGLSRLWCLNGPTPLDSAMGTFNSAFSNCPLCFADEALPKDFKGNTRTDELREFISAVARSYRRKNMHETSIRGAARVIAAANNDSILALHANLTQFDIEAIADRILHIEAQREASWFLEMPEIKAQLPYLAEEGIARHALWLVEHNGALPRGRFLVGAGDDGLIQRMIIRPHVNADICQWAVNMLTSPRPMHGPRSNRFIINRGRMLVNARDIVESWDAEKLGAAPRPDSVSHRLDSLAGQKTRMGDKRYRIINTDSLITWAEETGYATRDQILAALAQDTPQPADAQVIPIRRG